MATIDLGKIKQVFRGTYNNATAYVPDDLVVFTDTGITSTYICTTASTGNNPSSGGTAHANWAYVAKGQAVSPTTTQGDLVFRGSSADERLAIGAAGKVLKVNSSANGYEFGEGGGMVKLASASLTGQTLSNISIDYFSTTYKAYYFVFSNLRFSTGAYIRMRLKKMLIMLFKQVINMNGMQTIHIIKVVVLETIIMVHGQTRNGILVALMQFTQTGL